MEEAYQVIINPLRRSNTSCYIHGTPEQRALAPSVNTTHQDHDTPD